MTERIYKPGNFRVVEIGDIECMDGRTVKGAIIEFPAGPPVGMTWADIWSGEAFAVARPLPAISEDNE